MGDFWQKKMKTYFTRIDFDKDGAITRKDFEGMAERFIEFGKFDGAKAADLKKTLTQVWDVHLHKLGERLDKDKFIHGMKGLMKAKDKKDVLKGPLPLFFHAIDTDQDGMISPAEYKEFFRVLGLDTDLSDEAFKQIDTNHDKLLSEEEFIQAGTDFFTEEVEHHPSSLFWGKLL